MPYLTDTELSKYFETIDKLEAENARLTAAHTMQGEELVTLPRHMVYSMEDKLKAQTEGIRAIKEAIEDVKYYVGNPSAWEYYDDGVSEKIRAILKAAGMA